MPMFFFSAYCSSIGNHNLLGGAYGDIGSGGKMLNVSLVKTQREEWITHTRLQKLRLNIQYHCRVTYIVFVYNIILYIYIYVSCLPKRSRCVLSERDNTSMTLVFTTCCFFGETRIIRSTVEPCLSQNLLKTPSYLANG